MRKIIKAIDTTNEWTGRSVRWLAIFLMLVICAEVFMRYVLNKPTIQGPVIASFTGAALYSLSWGYVHLHKRHIRVDVFYARFPIRGKAIIDHTPMGRFGVPEDLIGTVLWLLSPGAAFVHGVVVPVDGGFSAFSGV